MSNIRLNVNLDKELYKKLKLKLMQRDETITDWIIRQIDSYVNNGIKINSDISSPPGNIDFGKDV